MSDLSEWRISEARLAAWCRQIILKYGSIEVDLFIGRLNAIVEKAEAEQR